MLISLEYFDPHFIIAKLSAIMKFSTIIIYTYIFDSETAYKDLVNDRERKRPDRRVPRCALRAWRYSTFLYLYHIKNDQALINATGHDHTSFDALLSLFTPYFKYWTVDIGTTKIRRKKLYSDGTPMGRRRDISACGCLGLVLTWYRTRGSCARGLVMMFGQTSSPLYQWLKFGRQILLHVLSRAVSSKVCVPNEAEVRSFQEAVGAKYPTCSDVWGAADAIKLLIQQPASHQKQLQFYNGWKSDHSVKMILVFSVDGKVRISIINGPGNFHDSSLSEYGLYERLCFYPTTSI